MLNKQQFDLLAIVEKEKDTKWQQRTLATALELSLGTVNKIVKELQEAHLIDENYRVTVQGLAALEPYRVTNAIVMAAGMSTRFAPLSYETPKGLLNVRGQRLIEREIEQLQEVGITDITVVVGYMKEKMFYLADKYGIKIVVNEDYYRYNNTSTLMQVIDQLDNTYICSSDNYFTENPFEKYVYRGYYSSVYADGPTDEYCLTTDSHGLITNVKIGGENAWTMLGHVYFDRSFSSLFRDILKREYEHPLTKEQLWEDLYIRYIKELSLYSRQYESGVINEFDSLDELRCFDEHYLNHTESKIFQNICSVLHCQESEITQIKPIKAGLTNVSFQFTYDNVHYVYRHPGVGTAEFISRPSEKASMEVAKRLGIDDTYIYMDETEGWKLSYFVDNARTLDYHNPSDVTKALDLLRTLHHSGEKTDYTFSIFEGIDAFRSELAAKKRLTFDGIEGMETRIAQLKALLLQEHHPVCLCHCDAYDPNFLVNDEDKIVLIDWEYSGMTDPACDLGTFIACSDYTYDEAVAVLTEYLQHEPTIEELRYYLGYLAVVSYYWFLWAIHQESVGKPVGEFLYTWYRYTNFYSEKALELYD